MLIQKCGTLIRFYFELWALGDFSKKCINLCRKGITGVGRLVGALCLQLNIMKQTVLITGASSGFGRETVKLFHQKGWNVVATMRSPETDTAFAGLEGVLVTRLDVTDKASIASAVAAAVAQFGG